MVILGYSCNSNSPTIYTNQNISLTKIDVAVSEAYLYVKIDQPDINAQIILYRDGQERFRFNAIKNDTIVTDTSLTELTNYSYKAQLEKKDIIIGKSEEITVQTLQPTSHNIFWEVYEFDSPGGTGKFNDIKIINENDIWVAGKIFDADSDGVYRPPATNALHWDGLNWESKIINFEYFYGYLPTETTAILGFNSNDVILASEHSVMHYNGTDWLPLKLLANIDEQIGSASYLWGTSSEKFFAGGNEGMLVQWDGINWSKINLGTTSFIVDIFGTQKNHLGVSSLYIAALYETEVSYQNELLKFDNNGQIEKLNFNQDEFILTVWTNSSYPIYTGGGGMFSNKYGGWATVEGTEQIYIRKIRGNGLNDIYAAGDRIMHYNGVDWKIYMDFTYTELSFRSLDIKGDIIAAVGYADGTPIVIIGKRI
jgi:hypothetical protein